MRRVTGLPMLREAGLFCAIVIALQLAGRQRMLQDPGTFWHTVVGERIIQTGSFPRTDWLSFSQEGAPWIAQQWLGEVAMAVIHRASGLDGLLWSTTVVLAGTFAFLGTRLQRGGIAWRHVILILTLAAAASSYHFLARPHIGTMAAMALMCALFCDVESGRLPITRLWLLPLFFIIWVNVHGGALGGLATAVVVMSGWIIRGKPPAAGPRSVVLIGAICSLCIATVLINPYGAALPSTWLRLMNSPVLPQMVVEHAPLNPLSFEGAMLMALAALYLGCLYKAWNAHRRTAWLIPLLWLPLAFSRVRHGPLFAVTAVVAIAEMWPFVSAARARAFAPAFPSLGYLHISAIGSSLLALGIAVQCAGLNLPVIGRHWANLSPEYWPTQSVKTLCSASRTTVRPPRIFNDMLFGGFLIYQMPAGRVFIDDRCELYGDAGLLDYSALCRNPDAFEAMAAYDDFDFALVERESILDRHLKTSTAWSPMAVDHVASLYSRRRG